MPKGPMYSFGLEKSIGKESDQIDLVVKPFDWRDDSSWLTYDKKTKTFRVG
jgi:hypothetical protein